MESSSDGDVSLSDLSIADNEIDSEYEDELKVPEVEPSTWVEIRNCGRDEAANRLLADVSYHMLLSTSSTPPVDASAITSTSDAFDNNNQKSMDCCGRATVALGLEKLCLLLHGSALKAPLESAAQDIWSSEPTEKLRASWGNKISNDLSTSLSLTASSLKCIETRVGRGGKHSKSTRVASAHKQAVSTIFTSNIPAQVDPKLFLSCKDANATSQVRSENKSRESWCHFLRRFHNILTPFALCRHLLKNSTTLFECMQMKRRQGKTSCVSISSNSSTARIP
tara:strand:+ start:1156 stop:1998 length:843 start_codon:yes stop_codon:yes gene_type:complete